MLPIITFHQTDIDLHAKKGDLIKKNLQNLKKSKYNRNCWERMYLEYVISNIKEILIGDLKTLQFHNNELNKLNKRKSKKVKELNQNLKKCFVYKASQLSVYFFNSGVKVCYICHAQFSIYANKDYKISHYRALQSKEIANNRNANILFQSRNSAKFQLDHYLPKSKYPVFAISLHNLYPCCSSCNQNKADKEIDIREMWSNIKFSLEPNSLKDYLYGTGQLKLILEDKSSVSSNFDLKGVYDNHLDYVEELIARKIKYTASYKDNLKKNFPGLVGTPSDVEARLITAVYAPGGNEYKRPLSRFINMIDEQLEGIAK